MKDEKQKQEALAALRQRLKELKYLGVSEEELQALIKEVWS